MQKNDQKKKVQGNKNIVLFILQCTVYVIILYILFIGG